MRIRGRFLVVMAVIGALVSMMSVMPASAGTAGTVALTGGVTTDSVIWYSTVAGHNTITVSVTDPDANVLTSLNTTNALALCTSGAVLVNFPCTILPELGGATAYTTPAHTNLEDSDGNDLPDNLLVRNLQDQVTGFLASGTSASTGGITLTAALGTQAEADRYTAGAVINTDSVYIAMTTNATQPARYGVVMTETGTTCEMGTEGVRIKGTEIHPVTFVETADQYDQIMPAGHWVTQAAAVAGGANKTTKIFKAGTVSFKVDLAGTCTAGSHEIAAGLKIVEYTTVVARFKYNQVDTIASTKVSGTSSAHTAVPLAIALTETGPATGIFSKNIITTATLAEHNTPFDHDSDGSGVGNTPHVNRIYASDGATFTFAYKDASPVATITKTAKADLRAPTITLVQPADKSYTNVTAQTFVVTVEDLASSGGKAAGLATGDVDNLVTQIRTAGAGTVSAALTPLLIGTNKFQTSFSETVSTNGVTKWWICTKDKVGNTPKFAVTNPKTAVPGAGNHAACTTTPAEPFAINIDTVAVTITTADTETGGKLTDTVVSSKNVTTWTANTLKKAAVTIAFDDGGGDDLGFAYLNSSTVVLGEWTVGGATPSSFKMDTANSTSKGRFLVFQMGANQATDARPYIEYTGTTAKDLAGNLLAKFSGTGSTAVGIGRVRAVDNLAAEITATTNLSIAQKEITITATSSEALSTTPTIQLTNTLPNNTSVTNPANTTGAVTQTSTTTWTAKHTIADNDAQGYFVVITGTDTANIPTIFGDDAPTATPKTDILYFELDYADPGITWADAGGNADLTNEVEGAVWITAKFDEDEDNESDYHKDNSTKVTINSITFKNKSTAEVLETDVTKLFTNDSIDYTLAINLTPGTYNFKIKGTDAMGNSKELATDVTVVKKTAYSLALKPGVNLVSIPGAPTGDGGNLDTMFGALSVTSVVTYDRAADIAGENPWKTSIKDAATGLFTGDITAVSAGVAYFVTADASATAKVFIADATATLPPTIAIRAGWNAVGYWTPADAATLDFDAYLSSITWSVAYSFDPTPGQGWTVNRPDGVLNAGTTAAKGLGYLVFATKDGTLTP